MHDFHYNFRVCHRRRVLYDTILNGDQYERETSSSIQWLLHLCPDTTPNEFRYRCGYVRLSRWLRTHTHIRNNYWNISLFCAWRRAAERATVWWWGEMKTLLFTGKLAERFEIEYGCRSCHVPNELKVMSMQTRLCAHSRPHGTHMDERYPESIRKYFTGKAFNEYLAEMCHLSSANWAHAETYRYPPHNDAYIQCSFVWKIYWKDPMGSARQTKLKFYGNSMRRNWLNVIGEPIFHAGKKGISIWMPSEGCTQYSTLCHKVEMAGGELKWCRKHLNGRQSNRIDSKLISAQSLTLFRNCLHYRRDAFICNQYTCISHIEPFNVTWFVGKYILAEVVSSTLTTPSRTCKPCMGRITSVKT